MSLASVTKTAPSLPSRVYLYAQEKWGKTSFATYAPDPIFVMTEGETGLLSLLEAGLVPETSHFPEDARSWNTLLNYCNSILREQHNYKTLVLDTSNGAERLLQQHILETQFNGQMTGKDGYASYGKGDVAAVPEWANFLRLLDDIRVRRRMSIILLAHSKIKAVNNPEGSDYDQLRPEGIDKLWGLTHKWADVIAAGTWDLFIKDDKARQGKGRVIRTSGSVAIVCGNRYALPDTIACGTSAQSAFGAFAKAMGDAKARGQKRQQQAEQTQAAAPPATEPPKDQSISQEQQKVIIDLLHRLGMAWNQGEAKTRAGEIIGRQIAINDHVSVITPDEFPKLRDALLAGVQKKEARQKPKAGAA